VQGIAAAAEKAEEARHGLFAVQIQESFRHIRPFRGKIVFAVPRALRETGASWA